MHSWFEILKGLCRCVPGNIQRQPVNLFLMLWLIYLSFRRRYPVCREVDRRLQDTRTMGSFKKMKEKTKNHAPRACQLILIVSARSYKIHFVGSMALCANSSTPTQSLVAVQYLLASATPFLPSSALDY
jgi:hypothetical protein